MKKGEKLERDGTMLERGSDLEFGSQHLPNKPGFLCRPVTSTLREAEKGKKKSREFDGF